MKWPPTIDHAHLPWWATLRDIGLTLAAWVLLGYLLRGMFAMGEYWLLYLLGAGDLPAPWPRGKIARDLVPFLYVVGLLLVWLVLFALVRWQLLTNTREGTSQPQPLAADEHDRQFGISDELRQVIDTASVLTMHLHDDGRIARIERSRGRASPAPDP